MKRILFILLVASLAQVADAQPARRRAEQQQKAQQSSANNMTTRAQISFPVAQQMS